MEFSRIYYRPVHKINVNEEDVPKGKTADKLWEWIENCQQKKVDTLVYCQISSTWNKTYQDGTPLVEWHDELVLYHSTRIGLPHSILRDDLYPSILSHGCTGLWTLAKLSDDVFEWVSDILESAQGCTPTLTDGVNRGLVSNKTVRGKGSSGFLRWVVAGQHIMNTALPIRITGVMIRPASPDQQTFCEGLEAFFISIFPFSFNFILFPFSFQKMLGVWVLI